MYQTIPIVRDMIKDTLVKCIPEVFEYVTSKTYTISESNIVWSTLAVYLNGVLLTSAHYSINTNFNKVTILDAMEESDTVEFYYQAYQRYSDDEIMGFIKSAIYYISVYRFMYDYIVASGNLIEVADSIPTLYPTIRSRRMIALIASILIDGGVSSYRTPDISISFTEKLSKDDKIERVVEKHRERYGALDYHSFLVAPDAWYPAYNDEDPYFYL
jgi:hypothetical protein